MNYDQEKVDEVSLALLFLTLGSDNRAWKGMDFDVSNRLHQKGWIEDPRNENKSFELTPAGREACVRLFRKHFGVTSGSEAKESLSTLPVDIDVLELLYYRDGDDRQAFVDAATGLIVRPRDREEAEEQLTLEELSSNPRYLPAPICTPEERSHSNRWSDRNRKRVRKKIRQWLEAHSVFYI